jgi:hypothetical protein
VTLQRDPRYFSVLTIPCVTLLAFSITAMKSATARRASFAALALAGIFGAALGWNHHKLAAHERFVTSPYNTPATALEPYVYFGVRAAENFVTNRIQCACAMDVGRASTIKQINHLPGTRTLTSAEARYLVLSVQMQPDKWRAKQRDGWRKVAEIPGEKGFFNAHSERVVNASQTPGLIVLENPAWPAVSTP